MTLLHPSAGTPKAFHNASLYRPHNTHGVTTALAVMSQSTVKHSRLSPDFSKVALSILPILVRSLLPGQATAMDSALPSARGVREGTRSPHPSPTTRSPCGRRCRAKGGQTAQDKRQRPADYNNPRCTHNDYANWESVSEKRNQRCGGLL